MSNATGAHDSSAREDAGTSPSRTRQGEERLELTTPGDRPSSPCR